MLQNDLARYGIPAKVTIGSFCPTDPALAGFSMDSLSGLLSDVLRVHVSNPSQAQFTTIINPAAMPSGTELSFGNFPDGTSYFRRLTAFTLIDPGSYTCSTTPPAPPASRPDFPRIVYAAGPRLP
jgi:hypothetical protein